jgi:hypothetical protein
MSLPPEAIPFLTALAPAFTQPTYRRFVTLLLAAVLTTGRRTVADLLRTLGGLAPGHRTGYQRVLSGAPWSALDRACALAGFILLYLVPDGIVTWSATTPSTATPAGGFGSRPRMPYSGMSRRAADGPVALRSR